MLTETDITRFWSYVAKADPSACWLWTKSCQRTGYGQFGVGRNGKSVMWYAHRLAYELTHGSVPEGLFVCHKCDVRACCNPNHLYVGSQVDNMRDMRERKRGAGKNGRTTNTKLTEEQVREIQEAYSTREYGTVIELAQKFGVDRNTITRAATGDGVWMDLQ